MILRVSTWLESKRRRGSRSAVWLRSDKTSLWRHRRIYFIKSWLYFYLYPLPKHITTWDILKARTGIFNPLSTKWAERIQKLNTLTINRVCSIRNISPQSYMIIHFNLHSPINARACGKNAERFCDQWSLIGICRYLNEVSFSNIFGTLGVTLRMYVMPYFFSWFMSEEFLALPRYKWGKTCAGKGDMWGVFSQSLSLEVPYEESSDIRRFLNPRIVDSVFSWAVQYSGKRSSNVENPPEIQDNK